MLRDDQVFRRRSVNALSADVVAYSRMIASDAVATVRTVSHCEDIITSHASTFGGRIFSKAGDGFLAEFPTPLDAVKCAIAIQANLRTFNSNETTVQQIWLRVGIDSGDAIDVDGNLHGDSINIAVRLQEACPSGGILVSGKVHESVLDDAASRFNSVGSMLFKNIPDAVQVFELEVPGADLIGYIDEISSTNVGGLLSGDRSQTSLAMLPFENVSGDPAHDFIADGFSDSLAVAVSHLRQFPVIDQSTNPAFSGDAISVRRIGQTLGARYLLRGKLHEVSDAFRISVRLIDCANEHLIWSETFTSPQEEMYDSINNVSRTVAATLEGRLEHAESARARSVRLSRADTLDLVWRGRWHLNKLTRKDSAIAKQLFEAALEQEPEHSEALIQLGFWYWIYCWSQQRPRVEILAFRDTAFQALNSNLLDSRGHFLIGCAEILLTNPEAGLEHFNQALILNPSSAHSLAQVGSCYMLMGQPAQAIEYFQASLQLNRQGYYLFVTLGELACSHCMLGNWNEAIACARRSLSMRPYYWHARMTEITALSNSGQHREAGRALDALLTRRPNFLDKPNINELPFKDRKWISFFNAGIASAHQAYLEQEHERSEHSLGRPA
tara:strand:- start:12077 stop:13912 length:1836 start_codon:yes stop_codon:yes gene_type:complete